MSDEEKDAVAERVLQAAVDEDKRKAPCEPLFLPSGRVLYVYNPVNLTTMPLGLSPAKKVAADYSKGFSGSAQDTKVGRRSLSSSR